jgi:hypothetical protein
MSAPIPLRRDFDASQLRGFTRKTKDGLMVSWTASRRGSHPSSTTATAEHLPAWSKVVRSRRSTAWCAGG